MEDECEDTKVNTEGRNDAGPMAILVTKFDAAEWWPTQRPNDRSYKVCMECCRVVSCRVVSCLLGGPSCSHLQVSFVAGEDRSVVCVATRWCGVGIAMPIRQDGLGLVLGHNHLCVVVVVVFCLFSVSCC